MNIRVSLHVKAVVLQSSLRLFARESGRSNVCSTSSMSEDGLVSIIPPNLKVLVLADSGGDWSPVLPALMGLADAIRPGRVTALRKPCL